MARDIDSKVIGYFSYNSPSKVVCNGGACVISGSEEKMKSYLKTISSESSNKNTIKKTRFSDIIQGMEKGASYAFDEQSYNRFYPLANKIGFNLKEEDFSEQAKIGIHLLIIRNGLRNN